MGAPACPLWSGNRSEDGVCSCNMLRTAVPTNDPPSLGLRRTGQGTPTHSVGLQGRTTAAGFGVRRLVGALPFEFWWHAVNQRQGGKRGASRTAAERRGHIFAV